MCSGSVEERKVPPMDPINLFEFEESAKALLDPGDYDFIAGGSTDEHTIRRTRDVYDSILIRPRRLAGVEASDLSTTVQGHDLAFPVMLAPTGGHGLVHDEGEVASVAVAGSMGILMILSQGSTRTLEDVAAAATGPVWFQHYIYNDAGLQHELTQRAEQAGFSGHCITVDSFGPSKRERDIRRAWRPKDGLSFDANYLPYFRRKGEAGLPPASELISRSATWADLERFAASTPLPVVVKGILTAEDARLAGEHGAKGVVVSAHGGRNLDTTVTPIEALPAVADTIQGDLEVYVDGGISRGTDILKALALGAKAVLIGRAVYWGLASGGRQGLQATLQILRDELDLAMAMTGSASIAAIDRSLVAIGAPLHGLSALRGK